MKSFLDENSVSKLEKECAIMFVLPHKVVEALKVFRHCLVYGRMPTLRFDDAC